MWQVNDETLDLDIDLTDTTKFSSAWVADRAVITDWSGNIFQATETARGWVERATDVEVTTWTDTTRYVTPDQLPKVAILQTTRLFSAATWTVNVAHWLSRVPKYIEIHAKARTSNSTSSELTITSDGFSDGTTDNCLRGVLFDDGSSIWKSISNDATTSIFMQNGTSAGHENQSATITFDATNIIFSWTRAISWSDPASWATIFLTMIAHA